MTICNAAMPSYTMAIKASRLLKAKGFSCEIKRIENITADGCGFKIAALGECSEIRRILDNDSIPYKNLGSG
jgi:hypothetical protein